MYAPTLAKLCDAKLPERKLDGKDIWPLMSGAESAKSPHDAYVLMHGPGTVRSGKWKFYPWPEGKGGKRDASKGQPSKDPVQLYDTAADISETKNVAAENPEIVKRLQAAYDSHLKEIRSHQRPTAPMERSQGSKSANRPGQPKKSNAKS